MQDPKNRQKFAIWAPSHNFVGRIFATKARIDNRKNCETAIAPLHVTTICRTSALCRLRSVGVFGASQQIQRVSRLGFVTAATSLAGGQPNFARYLAVSWAATVYIYIFGSFCPLTQFYHVQNSLYVQVLRSPVSAALLHGIPAAGASETLRCGTRYGITELSERAQLIFGWAAITLGISAKWLIETLL